MQLATIDLPVLVWSLFVCVCPGVSVIWGEELGIPGNEVRGPRIFLGIWPRIAILMEKALRQLDRLERALNVGLEAM